MIQVMGTYIYSLVQFFFFELATVQVTTSYTYLILFLYKVQKFYVSTVPPK